MNELEKSIKKSFQDHFLGGSDVEVLLPSKQKPKNKIVNAINTMSHKGYWTKPNIVEAWGFATKIAIIFPGLLLGYQWWWVYIFAIASSIALIWSSTEKTLPTIILFNVAWVILASLSIIKHFWWV